MSGPQFAATLCLLLAAAIGSNLALVIVATAPPAEETFKLLLVASDEDPANQLMTCGAEAAARTRDVELKSCRLTADGPSAEAILRELNAGEVDGVVLCGDAPQFPPQFHDLASRENVITCSEGDWPNRWYHIGSSPLSAGRIGAHFVASALPPGSPIIVLVDDASAPTVADRLAGFREGLRASPQFPDSAATNGIVACLEDFGQIEACIDNARRAVDSHPRAACLVDLGDRRQDSTVRRLASLARTAGVAFVTFDDSEAALAAVERGEVLAVMADDPYGQGFQAVDQLSMYCRGSELALPAAGRGSVNVPFRVIRRRDTPQSPSLAGRG